MDDRGDNTVSVGPEVEVRSGDSALGGEGAERTGVTAETARAGQDGVGDEELLRRFSKGDVTSLGELARRYEAHLLGVARGLLAGREDAARDAVQECWMRVIRHARRFRGGSSVKTWVYRILVNRCLERRASEVRVAKLSLVVQQHEAHTKGNQAGDPAAGVPFADLNEHVAKTVEQLPEGMRVVLVLCYHRGLTHQQAAEILDVPLGTLKTRLHGALMKLREAMAMEQAR